MLPPSPSFLAAVSASAALAVFGASALLFRAVLGAVAVLHARRDGEEPAARDSI